MEKTKIIIDISDDIVETGVEIIESCILVGPTNELIEEAYAINKRFTEVKDIKDKYIRVCADYTNLKKRSVQEKKEVADYTVVAVLKALLPFIDSINSVSFDNATLEKVVEGFELIKKQLVDVCQELEVEEINGQGEEYSSKVNEALNTIETDEFESGKITKVYLKGYKYRDKVIRQSMVEVAK